MHQLVIKEGSVLLMHGVTMKFNQCICLDSNKLTVKFCAVVSQRESLRTLA